MRERIFQIVQRARPGDKLSHAYDIFIVCIAFLSIIPLMFRPQDMSAGMAVSMNMLDVVTVYILFLDYILRWMTHDLKTGKTGWKEFVKYPFTPLAIIDLLAILPSLGVLPETFKFLRVLRVTKMFRYSKNLTIVANVFRSEKNTLLSVLVVAVMYIFVSGLIMFVNEPDTFDNFFDALYWATTALTTVGYGDVYPTTDLGKFISMVSSLFGIAVIALPAGIITGGFLEEIRQSQEDREAYFKLGEHHHAYKGRALSSYGSVRAYAQAHPKVVTYGAVMIACVLVNEGLYLVATAFGTPVWLDTVGTALAAILLEPAAGLIIAFANNLIQAVQFGYAGNLLYYCMGAIAALVFGVQFARGKKITLKSIGWALLFLVGLGTVVSCALTFSMRDGGLSTPTQQTYYNMLGSLGISGAMGVVATLFIDKLVDAVAVFAIVVLASRGIIGSRIDPARWFGAKGTADEAPTSDVPTNDEPTGDDTAADNEPVSDTVPTDPAARYVVGIDIGGTYTKVGAFTAEGTFVGMHVFDSQRVLADGTHAQLAHEMGAVLEKAGIEATRVAVVGLAVPGAVAAEDSLKLCPHLDLNLRSYKAFLRSLFPKASIVVMNDADAAVLGDCWRGSSSERSDSNIAFITLGTGVGSGMIMGGSLHASVHGAAGELGHLCVNPSEDEPCECGKTGCLEQYASAKGLVRMARKAFVAHASEEQPDIEVPESVHQDAIATYPDARTVLDAAARRDPAARTALTQFSDALGFGLAQVACLVDPDVFVLGGGLSERADLYLSDVRSRYRACAVSVCRDTPIIASKLGNECGMYGAAFKALETLADDEGESVDL